MSAKTRFAHDERSDEAFNLKRKAKKIAATLVLAAGLATGLGAQSASADYCSDFQLCDAPTYSVYYSYDWYWSNETLSSYQIRTCYWYSSAGYVYAVSYC